MKGKNNVLGCLKDSFKYFKNKKILLILLTQLVFFSLLSFVMVKTLTPAFEKSQAVMESMQNLNLEDEKIVENIFSNASILSPGQINMVEGFKDIAVLIQKFLIFSLIIFLIVNGLNWFFTDNLFKKDYRGFFTYMGNYILASLFYIAIFLVVLIPLMQSASAKFVSEEKTISYIPILLVSIVILYFMFITLSLVGTVKLNQILKKAWVTATKNVHIVLQAYAINALIMILSLVLMTLVADFSTSLTFLAMFLLVFIFVWKRIFFMSYIRSIEIKEPTDLIKETIEK